MLKVDHKSTRANATMKTQLKHLPMLYLLTFYQLNQVMWPRPTSMGKRSIFHLQWKALQSCKAKDVCYHSTTLEMTTVIPFTNEDRIPNNLTDLFMIIQFISKGAEIQLFVLEFWLLFAWLLHKIALKRESDSLRPRSLKIFWRDETWYRVSVWKINCMVTLGFDK